VGNLFGGTQVMHWRGNGWHAGLAGFSTAQWLIAVVSRIAPLGCVQSRLAANAWSGSRRDSALPPDLKCLICGEDPIPSAHHDAGFDQDVMTGTQTVEFPK
jgi:hypothetical protein